MIEENDTSFNTCFAQFIQFCEISYFDDFCRYTPFNWKSATLGLDESANFVDEICEGFAKIFPLASVCEL